MHGYLTDAPKQALRSCGIINNAGDTCSPRSTSQLEYIAPTVAAYGNCDHFYDCWPTVHDVARPSYEGVRFYVAHRPEDAPPKS